MGVKDQVKAMPAVGSVARRAAAALGRRRFAGSANYWESRYQDGGTSGAGSYGKLAEHKADVLNRLVTEHRVQSVLELGCGDGAQLELATYPTYTGVDVAHTTLDRCRERFSGDSTKRFVHLDDLAQVSPHELALSLDVVYHLVEDVVFEAHMRALFEKATRLVVVYASNEDRSHPDPHVRHREFTRWVAEHQPGWRLAQHIPNRYPAAVGQESDETSFADFYVFKPA